MNKRKILTLLLVVCLMFGMMPTNAFASSNGLDAVSSGDYDIEMRLNDWVELDLSDYVSGATSYQVTKDGEQWKTINKNEYNYYPEGYGERVLYIVGYDESGNEVGDALLDVYVEVPPSEVTVTFSVTKDVYGFYTCAETGIACVPTELTVPYFDLKLYDLEKYYYNPLCYDGFTGMGQGTAGTVETANGIVTPMHVMIYATEVLYLGYSEDEAGKGKSFEDGLFNDSISWNNQPAGSTFVSLWDHGTNLNYYVDWNYPIGAPATDKSTAMGSTADQIVLYGGEDISFHLIGEDSMVAGSSFGFFVDGDEYTPENQVDVVYVNQGESISLTRVIASEDMMNPCGTQYEPYYDGEYAYWIPESTLSGDVIYEWNWWEPGYTYEEYDNGECDDFYLDGGMLTIDTTNLTPGTYYFGVGGMEYNWTECGATAVKVVVVDPAVAALAQAKAEAKATVEGYKNAADYRDAEKATLADEVAKAVAAIEAAETEAEVTAAVEAATTAMDAIKTDAELKAEEEAAAVAALAQAKAEAKATVEGYKNAADYRDAEKATLADEVAKAVAAIEAAETEAEVTAAVEAAKIAMDAIKTDAELKAETPKTETPVTGDANNLAMWFALMAVAMAGAVATRRREN